MSTFTVKRVSDGAQLAGSALLASRFLHRAKGLLGKALLLPGEALIINPCNMVHMLFMRFPIDVIFCGGDGRVLYICENLQPWKFSRHVPQSKFVIELPVGIARSNDITVGDTLTYLEN